MTFPRAPWHIIGVVALAVSLTGCTSVYRSAFNYDIPEEAEPLPAEYPNVYTTISRDDQLKSPSAKERQISELEQTRATHATRTRRQIYQ